MAVMLRGSVSLHPQNIEDMKPHKQRRMSLENSRNIAYQPRKNSIWQRVKKTVSDSFSSQNNVTHNTIRRAFSSACDMSHEDWRIQESNNIVNETTREVVNHHTPSYGAKRARRIISTVNSESILHFAVVENDVALVSSLLKSSNVDINCKRPPGMTPLHQACNSGNTECAKSLVENGAKVNMKDWKGRSALKLAVCAGNFELAEFLIQNGAAVDDIRDGFQQEGARPRSRSNITMRKSGNECQ